MVLRTQNHPMGVLLAAVGLATVFLACSAYGGSATASAVAPERAGDQREVTFTVEVVATEPATPNTAPVGPVLLPLNPPYLEMPPVAVDEPDLAPIEEDRLFPADAGPSPSLEGAVQPVLFSGEGVRFEPVGTSGVAALPEVATPDEPAGTTTLADNPDVAPPADSVQAEPKPQLTADQAALADRLRRTLAFYRGQALGGTRNTATEIMDYCLPFGCDTEIYRGSSSGQKINAITYLCWDYPCAGYEPLALSEGHIAARVGYGVQSQPSQLLAVLALSRVKPTYPMRVGEDVRTVADLVEYEKLSCRAGTDQSRKLIGLAHYAGDEATWENSLGEQWTVERIVEEELDQPVLTAPFGGTDRLMGLSYALQLREIGGGALEGQFLRARQFLDEYHDYALKVQNSDGSWGPSFLAAKGASRDLVDQLLGTGHVLQWLVMSLPEDRLDDTEVVRAVEYAISLVNNQRYRSGVATMSTSEISAVMHALSALAIYDQRFLAPRTPAAQ